MYCAVIIESNPFCNLDFHTWLRDQCPEVKISASVNSAEAGINAISFYRPDFVILDCDRDKEGAMDVLRQTKIMGIKTILVSVDESPDFRSMGYEGSQMLVKPFDGEAFSRAVFHSIGLMNIRPIRDQFKAYCQSRYRFEYLKLALTTEMGLVFSDVNSIIRCEASGKKVRFFFTKGNSILSEGSLRKFFRLLCESKFMPANFGTIVNLKQVLRIEGQGNQRLVMMDGHQVEIEKKFKKRLLANLSGLQLN